MFEKNKLRKASGRPIECRDEIHFFNVDNLKKYFA